MIVLRLAGGIRQHFGMRLSEWVMALPLFGWSMALSSGGDAFAKSDVFAELARYGDALFWSNICIAAGFVRLIALVINGTFRQFQYAPHLRAGASLVAAIFWGQIALAVTLTWLGGAGVGTGMWAYGTFVVFELCNTFRAWADIGAQRKAG